MFSGSMVAMVTPMHEDGRLDESSLARLIDFHVDQGTNAIVSVGTTGESATLDFEEHEQTVRRTVELAAGRIPIIAGTGANSTQEAIRLTRSAQASGADACLLVTPYYNKPTQEGLYQHYKKVADAVDIPQILYNVPSRTSVDMQPETAARLAPVDNIIAIKEATGKFERLSRTLALCGDQLAVYSGDDATAMDWILEGAQGDISVTANVAPKAMAAMCQAALAGDRDKAEQINAPLLALHRDLFLESNPIPVKWALTEMDLIEAGIRLPLTPLHSSFHETVRNALQKAGVL